MQLVEDYEKIVMIANIVLQCNFIDECKGWMKLFKRIFMAKYDSFANKFIDEFFEDEVYVYIGIFNWNFQFYSKDMVLSLLMFNEKYFLKNDEFIGSHMLAVQCINESDVFIEEELLMICYMINQCLRLFCLMFCVKICDTMNWMSELKEINQHDDVWINIGDLIFYQSNFIQSDIFDKNYEFCDVGGVYSPMTLLFSLQVEENTFMIPFEE